MQKLKEHPELQKMLGIEDEIDKMNSDIGKKKRGRKPKVQAQEEVYLDDEDDDFPLREGSSPGGIAPPEGKSAPAQVPPRGGGAAS